MADEELDWMAQGPLSLLRNLHHMPKHIEKMLSNFNPDKKTKDEDHTDDFYMYLVMLHVHFDDVSCRHFLYTLEGRASIWYHSLPAQFNS